MSQSRKMSLIESFSNVAVGYFVAVASQVAIFPMFGIQCRLRDNFLIGLWFTAISIVRSYALRRWFNRDRTRKCAACRKPLELNTKWQKRYRLYCSECGFKP